MKFKILLPLLLASVMFSCQKTTDLPEQTVGSSQENLSAGDRSCSLEVTLISQAGTTWTATIYAEGTVVAKICGDDYAGPGGYSSMGLGDMITVSGSSYKKYRIVTTGQNVTFNLKSDAGCFDLACAPGGNYPFFAGCGDATGTMTIKINSTTSPQYWLAEMRIMDEFCQEYVTTIGGASSGSDLYLHTGAPNTLTVEGFKLVSFKQLVGTVSYTLGASSAGYAPLLPSTGFNLNPGGLTSRRLGASN